MPKATSIESAIEYKLFCCPLSRTKLFLDAWLVVHTDFE